MSNILNITNGDCAIEIMKKANIKGVLLPWRDVLHEGPVPIDLSLRELSKLERWVGGVHLKVGNVWCWDSGSSSVVKQA